MSYRTGVSMKPFLTDERTVLILVRLAVSIPITCGAGDDAEFVRNQYYGLEWQRLPPENGASAGGTAALGAGALLADIDCGCELRLTRAGAFHFYFVYDTA